MELRVSRATAVVVHRLPPAAEGWFLDWQRGVSAAAEGFPGYRGTDVYPPTEGGTGEWVAMLHYEDEKSLRAWLDSPTRAAWLAKYEANAPAFELTTLAGGFGPWFAGLSRGAAPPAWKMALTVLLGLYPTVMLLAVVVGPYTARLGPAAALLVGNALSVSLLQWAVMPVLTRAFARWLRPRPGRDGRANTAAGLAVIAGLLAGLVVGFRAALE